MFRFYRGSVLLFGGLFYVYVVVCVSRAWTYLYMLFSEIIIVHTYIYVITKIELHIKIWLKKYIDERMIAHGLRYVRSLVANG